MENEQRLKLESRIATASGILAGAGLTALSCYNPEFIPYIVVGGVVGGVIGGGGCAELIKEPSRFAKRMLTYGILSSALVFGGNYLGRNTNEVRSAIMPSAGTNNVESIVLQSKDSERPLYEYGTNNVGKVFLPKKEILRLESEKLRNNLDSTLENVSEKYK